jgi:protein O-mannosyl-transferase
VLAVVATYAPVVRYGFVNFDDPEYVSDNSVVQRGISVAGLRWALGFHAANWHPLTWVSHMMDCRVFGVEAGGHHAVNVGLHVGAAVLLFLALARMTGAPWRSGVVAALFAVHPLRVESVAWISERKDVLGGFFWMLALLAYARYAERPTRRGYVGVALAFVAGLLAKPTVVTLPFALLLLDVWPLRRPQPWVVLVREKVPLVAVAALVSVVVYRAQHAGGAVTSFAALPLSARLLNALVSYGAYLWMTIWPEGLAVFYPAREIVPLWQVALAATVLAAVTAIAWSRARRSPGLLVGWLWYLGTLVPVIGIIRAGDQAMADRFTYLPHVGLFVMVVWGLAETMPAPAVLPAAAVAAIATAIAVSVVQVGYWRDSLALFGHALAVTERNAVAHTNYGFALLEHGQTDRAFDHFREAVQIRPSYAKARLNYGFGLATIGRSDEAIAEYREAIRLAPEFVSAHYDLGLELAERGRFDEAIVEYREAARLDPENAKVRNNLGLALAHLDRVEEATAQYERALALDPRLAPAHNNLAVVLERLGREEEALTHYREAVRLIPADARGHYNLGSVLAGRGRWAEAASEFRETLRLRPDLVDAHLALGDVLARQERGAEALAEYRAALAARPDWTAAQARIAWTLATGAGDGDAAEAVRLAEKARDGSGDGDPEVLRALAASYAAAGRFGDAAQVARRAVDLARAAGREPLATELESHVAAYEAGRPLRGLVKAGAG